MRFEELREVTQRSIPFYANLSSTIRCDHNGIILSGNNLPCAGAPGIQELPSMRHIQLLLKPAEGDCV